MVAAHVLYDGLHGVNLGACGLEWEAPDEFLDMSIVGLYGESGVSFICSAYLLFAQLDGKYFLK
jgi:hypothetical protein